MQTRQQQGNHGYENDLPRFDPDVEHQKGQGYFILRYTDLGQCSGETQAMHQAESKRHQPGKALRGGQLALVFVNDLDRQQHDAQ